MYRRWISYPNTRIGLSYVISCTYCTMEDLEYILITSILGSVLHQQEHLSNNSSTMKWSKLSVKLLVVILFHAHERKLQPCFIFIETAPYITCHYLLLVTFKSDYIRTIQRASEWLSTMEYFNEMYASHRMAPDNSYDDTSSRCEARYQGPISI